MKRANICIVIPAYNEATTIADVVSSVKKHLKSFGVKSQIVVVDDGSTDETAHLAAKSGAKVISHILNSGAGAATATGLEYAKQQGLEVVATMDADGQHSTEDLVKGVRLLQDEGYDLLIGSRLINTDGMSKVKILGNRGLSAITRVLFKVNVTDSQSGLRVMSQDAVDRLTWKSHGYEFCSEMLWRAHQLRFKIGEYPIKAIYTEYSRSKGQNNWNAVNIIKSLINRRLAEMFK